MGTNWSRDLEGDVVGVEVVRVRMVQDLSWILRLGVMFKNWSLAG